MSGREPKLFLAASNLSQESESISGLRKLRCRPMDAAQNEFMSRILHSAPVLLYSSVTSWQWKDEALELPGGYANSRTHRIATFEAEVIRHSK